MANLNETTRREQVLSHLQKHSNQWVDGPELANEEVGGSEGLKRLRELRADGHRIITRAHPDPGRDIYQYKLVPPETIAPIVVEMAQEATTALPKPVSAAPEPEPMITPGMAGREMPMRLNKETGEYELAFEVCVDCQGPYKGDEEEHKRTDGRHLRWEAQQRAAEYEQKRIELDPQPPAYRYVERPTKLVVGESVPCPRCKGYFRPRKLDRRKGEWTEAEDFSRDPFKPTKDGQPNPCPRCGGHGIVPNSVQMESA
jgi:hypothetical protein